MKLFKGLVTATIAALQEIFLKQRQADRVVEQVLKSNSKWGARDRAFIAENTFEIVRWWRLILTVADVRQPPQPEQFWLIFGVWQMIKPIHLKLDVVDQLPDWIEFSEIDSKLILKRYNKALTVRKIAQSVPDWIDEIGEKELGASLWQQELSAMNVIAPLTLRVNSLLAGLPEVRVVFGEDNTEVIPEIPDALILKKRQNISSQPTFKKGYYEVQDAGSQLIAPFLEIAPDHKVIDACAGAGGKTLHIAALMTNKGSILSMDIEKAKLLELQRRVVRNGVKNVQTQLISSGKVIKDHLNYADRLLLDVPCSGLGVLRRNPDAKWKLKPEFLTTIRETQWKILSTYCYMLKKGGKMVYATCSILPSESEEQVARFIEVYGNEFKLLSEKRTSVARDGYDGFYMALLERL